MPGVLGQGVCAQVRPALAGVVSHRRAENRGQWQRHAGGILHRRYAKPRLRMRHLGADLWQGDDFMKLRAQKVRFFSLYSRNGYQETEKDF